MKVLSVNVGLPRTVDWEGRSVTTGIFKAPVSGRIRLGSLNFDGDRQADLTAHGGADKAVYAYPIEHYPFWQHEYPAMALPHGAFGENLTTEGVVDDTLKLGARLRIGSAELIVTQPRLPCYKLGIRFGDQGIIQRMMASGRQGVYFRVAVEGEIAAGDAIEMLDPAEASVPLAEVSRLYGRGKDDVEGMRRIVALAALPEDWRGYFEKQIARRTARDRATHHVHPDA